MTPVAPKAQTMSSLEEIGISGTEYLRETLTNCVHPISAIEEFQDQNGILLPSLKPALHFLDLHGISRLDFHQSVVTILKDSLLQTLTDNVANLPEAQRHKKLNELMDKSFPLVKNKELQPVVLHIMKYLPKIKEEYLSVIENDPELYKVTAIEVKRQIWARNQVLFGQEVSTLLNEYAVVRHRRLLTADDSGSGEPVPAAATGSSNAFFTQSPRSRRQEVIVRTLVEMIGSDVYLYDMMLQFLRTLFVRSRNTHYCALRVELLMALHDNDVQSVCAVDPSHKFAWCLDACVRDGLIDPKRLRELQGFLETVRRGQDQVLGDLAMVLCDPYAMHTVCLTISKLLQQLIAADGLPRENSDLVLMVRFLLLGLSAWSMMDSQVLKEPQPDPTLIISLMPSLMAMVVSESVRHVTARLPGDSTLKGKSNSNQPSLVLTASPTGCMPAAAAIAIYFAVYGTSGLKESASVFVGILEALEQMDVPLEDSMLHILINGWAQLAEELSTRGLFVNAFEKFYLARRNKDSSLLHHAVRLLSICCQRLPGVQADQAVKALAGDVAKHSDSDVIAAYNSLSERVSSRLTNVATESQSGDQISTLPYSAIVPPQSP